MDNPMISLDRNTILELLRDTPQGEEILLQVTGWSMLPLLFHNRSLVYLKKEEKYLPRKGDIVLFVRLNGTIVLHRVHKVGENGVLTINGDAQKWTEQIFPNQVLATVTHFVRRKRDVSVHSFWYRAYVRLWCPARWLHPVGAKLAYYLYRLPYKLFGKK